MVAISYDSEQILRHFSDRLGGFRYPLLADPESTIIRDFGIFNDKVPESHPWYGICFPGTYIGDRNGVVQTKFFEQLHTQRVTADTVLVVPRLQYDKAAERRLIEEIRSRLGDEIEIQIEIVNEITREPNGKFRAVKSAIGNIHQSAAAI